MVPTPAEQQADGLDAWLDGRSINDWQAEFDEQGYLVFERVLDNAGIQQLRDALQPFLDNDLRGRNDFEGLKSNRVYAMLAKSPVFAELAIHPLAMAFVDAELGPGALLSACLAINLQPGETVQPWHQDDGHISLPLPRDKTGVSAFWVLDDTTEENGATEILPGSHRWSQIEMQGQLQAEHFADKRVRDVADDPGQTSMAKKICMPAGSLMLAKACLWHRGGANHSNAPRLIITPQYCAGWARPLESMLLAVPPETAATLPKRAQELIGYSIQPPFMGYVDGMHPGRLLLQVDGCES